MHGNKKRYCSFFQLGKCKKGASCTFVHEIDPTQERFNGSQSNTMMESTISTSQYQDHSSQHPHQHQHQYQDSTQSTQNKTKICDFFLKGSCNKTQCRFFHGYSENLQNVNIEKIHERNIVDMCQINDKKFITADSNSVQIWLITESEHKIIGTQNFEENITRVTFSNEKVIVATQIEKMYVVN